MIPEIVMYYNRNKGGVDTVDEMLSTYSSQFPSRRWTMKVIYSLLISFYVMMNDIINQVDYFEAFYSPVELRLPQCIYTVDTK